MQQQYLNTVKFWLRSTSIVIIVFFLLLLILKACLFKSPNHTPKIVSLPSHQVNLGNAYIYDEDSVAEATGKEPFKWTVAKSVPEGFTIDKDGKIQWQPKDPGVFDVGIQVSNDSGRADTQKWAIQVLSKPEIEDPGMLEYEQGKQFTYPLKYRAYPESVSFAIVSKDIPDGLTINQKTGVLSWTPNKNGTFPITIEGRNEIGSSKVSFKINVVQKLKKPPPPKKHTKPSEHKNKKAGKSRDKTARAISVSVVPKESPEKDKDFSKNQKASAETTAPAIQQIKDEIKRVEANRTQRNETAEQAIARSEQRQKTHENAPDKAISSRVTEALKDVNKAEGREKAAKNNAKHIEAIERKAPHPKPEIVEKSLKKAVSRAKAEVDTREKETQNFYKEYDRYRDYMKQSDKKERKRSPEIKTTVNSRKILHHSDRIYTPAEARKVLNDQKHLTITLVWYEDQIEELMDTFSKYGNAFAFIPPNGRMRASDSIYVVQGLPDESAWVKKTPISSFYRDFSLRCILMSTERSRERVEKFLKLKVKNLCAPCTSYEMKLFLSYRFYAVVLSAASTFAKDNGVNLEQDVANVEWMLKPAESMQRIEIVTITTHSGTKFAYSN